MLGGVVAAGLGLGVIAVLVLFMWITSPYPDSGPDAALRVAAALWLLAHGADLLRTDALTGASVPVGVTPLLLMALPGWLVHRAAAHALAPEEDPAPENAGRTRALGPVATTAWLAGGYLLVAAVILLFAQRGALRGIPLSALLNVPLVAVAAAACGAWRACGRPPVRPSAAVCRVMTRMALPYGGVVVALRAAAVGVAVLVGGGALLAAAAMAWHAHATADAFGGLTGSFSGRFAVLLLTVALAPNAALWAASYALGTGFALGTGNLVTPAGAPGHLPVLPAFPLLAALPGQVGDGGAGVLAWCVTAAPVAAGVALGLYVSRIAVARGWTTGRTTTVTTLAAGVHGTVMAVAAAVAGGPLGVGTLAAFGPDGVRAGAAAAGWAAVVGLPVALLGRWWRTRGDGAGGSPGAQEGGGVPAATGPEPASPSAFSPGWRTRAAAAAEADRYRSDGRAG